MDFRDYRGKLLVDLSGSEVGECARHIKHLRPMMPITAVFGAKLPPGILELDQSYYAHKVQYFDTEAKALEWLRNQQEEVYPYQHCRHRPQEMVRERCSN